MNRKAITTLLTATALIACGSAKAGEIVFVDSYHADYAWSAGITRGIEQALADSGHTLSIVRMDTKRNKGEEFKVEAAKKALEFINEKDPDVVIACDDNAAKYLIVPHLKDTDRPVVFCGLNWDASGYGFPAKNVTGMVEVASLDELVSMLVLTGKGDRVGMIGSETASERKTLANIEKTFGDKINLVESAFVKDFDEFKKAYVDIQSKVDVLFFSNKAGIDGWDDKAAAAFVEANTTIPTGSIQPFMQDFVTLVFGKVAEEQGKWSANAAMDIIGGKKVSDIPVVTNKEGVMIINARIAQASGVEIPGELVEVAASIVE